MTDLDFSSPQESAKGPSQDNCVICGADAPLLFYERRNVPVQSMTLIPTREEALHYPAGDIRLSYCERCGFISNSAFKSDLLESSGRYEESQAFSATFDSFHRRLAQQLIQRHRLRGKKILEIGCGKGEFLLLLCQIGGNEGVGFDPHYVEGRLKIPPGCPVSYVQELYSEKHHGYPADFVCCKMTLEHIPDPRAFVEMVRRTLEGNEKVIVFFQVPDTRRILLEAAFWDVYYEHCSYFTRESLAALFRLSDFEVLSVEEEYDGQYLAITARPAGPPASLEFGGDAALRNAVCSFSERCRRSAESWLEKIASAREQGGEVVLWGGGSKAVGFLTTLELRDEIEAVVDINPFRQNTYLAGSGHQIVAPDWLKEHPPALVVVMNPVYAQEINRALAEMSLHPEVAAL